MKIALRILQFIDFFCQAYSVNLSSHSTLLILYIQLFKLLFSLLSFYTGPRMFSNSKEMLRRKLEQVELQQAIELQGRKIMNFQLSELKNYHHGHQFQPNRIPGITIPSPAPPHLRINQSHLLHSNSFNQEILEG